MAQRRGKRRQQVLDYLKGGRGYCKLKEAARDRAVWRSCSERCGGTDLRMVYESRTPSVASSGQLGR